MSEHRNKSAKKKPSKAQYGRDGQRIETRGRPRKQVPNLAAKHWRTVQAEEQATPKLLAIQSSIEESFGSMRGFLRAWSENAALKTKRDSFMLGGAREMIELWMPIVLGLEEGRLEQLIISQFHAYLSTEVEELMREQGSILCYVGERGANLNQARALNGRITGGLDEMVVYVKDKAPNLWKVCELVGVGEVAKSKTPMVVLSAILGLVNNRNQKVNAYQTMIGAFLYANHIPKSGLEVLQGLGVCCSYVHLNQCMKQMAEVVKSEMSALAKQRPMKIVLDNVNQMVGIRDGCSTRQSLMDNSTGGFACPVRGLEFSGMRSIPKAWKVIGGRVNLDPANLGPIEEALNYMSSFRKFQLFSILQQDIGDQLPATNGNIYKLLVVERMHAAKEAIFPLGLMRSEQASAQGNLDGIDSLGRQGEEIQKLRESDVPGEDFSGVTALLGPFHIGMNFKKAMLKQHLGVKDGSLPGSLFAFNKKLRRQYIDETASNYWNCIDFTRDSLEAVLRGLMVFKGGCENWEQFQVRVKRKEIDWVLVVEEVDALLEYCYVPLSRGRPEAERDEIFENILLFARQEMEFRAYYKATRMGDVGAMEYILQLWGPQFLGDLIPSVYFKLRN
ncbi:hypothetical protein BGX38DRAFT_1296301 [Terfezia claveryi]|nr:hypothetical protein BGX38DRAFT_1296301 [Terfezia claveryi]